MAAATLLCAIVTTLTVTVFPKVTQLVLDDVRAGRSDRLLPLVLLAAGAFLARDVFNALRIVLNTRSSKRSSSICAAIFTRTSSSSR